MYDTAGEVGDELIRNVLLWAPSLGPTYSSFEDTGCSPEDLPEVMNDREEGEKGSRISLLVSRQGDDDIINECTKLAQKEYKTRHDWVGDPQGDVQEI